MMDRFQIAAVFAASALTLLTHVADAPPVSAQWDGPVATLVTRVEDGNLLTVKFGSDQKVLRLDGLRLGRCMGSDATQRLHGLVAGRAIQLQYDRSALATTGELAGYAWVDGVMLNLILVSEGYAVRSSGAPEATYDREVVSAERNAQALGLGLWSRCP
jgi:endonuclease YncB( thermonuclease family)